MQFGFEPQEPVENFCCERRGGLTSDRNEDHGMTRKTKTKLIVIVLAVLVLGGLLWHTFTRQVTLPDEPTTPSGQSYLYLYPEEETIITWRGYTVWIEDEAALPEGWGNDFYGRNNYYRVYPDGRIVSDFWKKEYGRLEWKPAAQQIYSSRTGSYTLYWDAAYPNGWTYDFTEGWCVPGPETEAFLRDLLPQTGLNETETADVIADWLPELEKNAWNLLAFHVDHDEIAVYRANAMEMIGDPLRVFFLTQPLDAPVELTPQTFEPFAREGFTVVQWGGVKIS